MPNNICPLCGGANDCVSSKAGGFEVECWCTTVSISREVLALIPPDAVNKSCLCPRCAAGLKTQRGEPKPQAASD